EVVGGPPGTKKASVPERRAEAIRSGRRGGRDGHGGSDPQGLVPDQDPASVATFVGGRDPGGMESTCALVRPCTSRNRAVRTRTSRSAIKDSRPRVPLVPARRSRRPANT